MEIDIHNIIYNSIFDRQTQLQSQSSNLAYYTDATTALSIINNKEIWLRNARCMNDWSEIDYGSDLLSKSLEKQAVQEKLTSALNKFNTGLYEKVMGITKSHIQNISEQTYVCCLTEHDPQTNEDSTGRLSMWRAYGRDCPVALIIRHQYAVHEQNNVEPEIFPVEYDTPEQFQNNLIKKIENLDKIAAQVPDEKCDYIADKIFKIFFISMTCYKHPGLHEEKEWRLILNRNVWKTNQETNFTESSIETISGKPQKVYKLPLARIPQLNGGELSFDNLVSHVVIGPSDNPRIVEAAFVDAMEKAGLTTPEDRVRISGIPLRS